MNEMKVAKKYLTTTKQMMKEHTANIILVIKKNM